MIEWFSAGLSILWGGWMLMCGVVGAIGFWKLTGKRMEGEMMWIMFLTLLVAAVSYGLMELLKGAVEICLLLEGGA